MTITDQLPSAPVHVQRTLRTRQLTGAAMVLGALAWVGFRMFRRLRVEPYYDFKAFHDAARAVTAGEDIYLSGEQSYVYPPMLAAWMTPFVELDLITASWIWFGLSLSATLLALYVWWSAIIHRFRFPSGGWLPALGLALLVWIEQVRREFETGQCDWLMMVPVMLGAVVLIRRPILAGILLGFAIHIKYLPLLILAWLVLRGHWRAVAATVFGIVLWALLPALVYGWDRNLDYLTRSAVGLGKLVGIHVDGQPGTVFPLEYDYSVSIPSGFARLAARYGYGHREAFLAIGGMALLVLAIAGVIYRRNGWSIWTGRSLQFRETEGIRGGRILIEYCALFAVMLAFSPQTQNRHLFVYLPAILLGTAFLAHDREWIRVGLALTISVLGTALLGSSEDVLAGIMTWGYVGGGGLVILATALLLLDASLRQLNLAAKQPE